MRLNKMKGAVIASVIVLSIGAIAVKAAPSSEKQRETSSAKTTENTSITSTVIPTISPSETITVTPTISPSETISVTPENTTMGTNDSTLKVTPIVVSSTKYKEVTLLTKADIKELTGFELTLKNVSAIYKQLKESATWKAAGYSTSHVKLIVARFENSYEQANGILKKLAKSSNLNLKVVVIEKPNYQNAYLGVSGYNSETENSKPSDDKEGNTNTGVTTTPESAKTMLKELEVNIDYDNGSVELEYSVKLDGTIKVKYENDFTKEVLQGNAAQKKMEELLQGLEIKVNSQTTIEDHILSKLNLEKGYKQFQFEASYNDGKEIEFEK